MTKIKLQLELEAEVDEISIYSLTSIYSNMSVGTFVRGVSLYNARLSDGSLNALEELANLRASTITENNSN